MRVTVGIKALNEEARIGAALSSAVAAVQPVGGEVVLADSGSTDRTLEIAAGFPVRVVQLENSAERCCGAGAQLAFQHASTPPPWGRPAACGAALPGTDTKADSLNPAPGHRAHRP